MKHNKFLLFYFIGVVLFGSFVFVFGVKLNYNILELKNFAQKGTLDLSEENFDANEYAILRGDWEFYWNELLTPRDFKNEIKTQPCYIELPGIWNNFNCNGIETTAQGFATYRLKILLSEPGYYGLRIKEFDCAYKLWVNTNDSILSGQIGKNKADEIPNWRRNEVYFHTDSATVEIVLQISNFNHRKGGAEDAIIFSKGQEIYKYKLIQIAVAFFMLGFFILMVLNYLVLYIYRTKDKSLLLFALMNLLMAIRLGTIGEKVLLDIFQQIPWGLAIRLEYLSYTLSVPVIYAFFRSLFPDFFSKIGLKLVSWAAGIVTAMVLFTPSTIFTFTPIAYQIVVAIAAVYALIVLVQATLKKTENAFIVLGGYVFFFMGTFNDILYYNNTIETSFLMPFGLFVMIFTQAFVLSKNNAEAYKKSELLSQQLEEYNRTLEQKVFERTKELGHQKSELERKSRILELTNAKLNKLNEFIKEMTHMIVHDLKNPLSAIINIDSIIDESKRMNLVKQSGYRMLNLVQNILDVYKYDNLKMELNREAIQLLSIVKLAIHEIDFLAGLKNLKFEVNIDMLNIVYADVELIKRVLANLLSNAVKFSPENGKITINARAEINDEYRISILNDGPGIPKDKQSDIFNKFRQFEKRSQGQMKSTGLGLTFCKMAIKAHGGKIGVISEGKDGVEFWFTLTDNNYKDDHKLFENGDLELTDKKLLEPFVDDLKLFSVYEVSSIMQVLNRIESDSATVENWKHCVEKAIYASDDEEFKRLLLL